MRQFLTPSPPLDFMKFYEGFILQNKRLAINTLTTYNLCKIGFIINRLLKIVIAMATV